MAPMGRHARALGRAFSPLAGWGHIPGPFAQAGMVLRLRRAASRKRRLNAGWFPPTRSAAQPATHRRSPMPVDTLERNCGSRVERRPGVGGSHVLADRHAWMRARAIWMKQACSRVPTHLPAKRERQSHKPTFVTQGPQAPIPCITGALRGPMRTGNREYQGSGA